MSQIQIPKGWELVKLGDLGEYKYGYNGKASSDKTGRLYLRITDINSDGSLKPDRVFVQISDKDFQKYQLQNNDIVIARTGATVGKSFLFNGGDDFVFASYLIRYRFDVKKILPKFLQYVLRSPSFWNFIGLSQNASAQPNVNATKMSKFEFNLPPIETQKKIVQKLDYILQQFEEKKKVIVELKTEQVDQLKYLDKKFVDDIIDQIFPLNEPPSSWEKGTVTDFVDKGYIIEFQDGNHGELHPKKSDFSDVGRYFITAKQIDDNGNVLLDTCKRLPEKFCKKLRIGFTEPNDVLFTHNATVGRVAILPSSAPSSIIGTSVTYYRLNKNKIFNTFFFYLFRSRFIRRQYEPIMKQTTRNQFSILKQAKLNLVIPSLVEQYALVKKLERLFLRMKELSPVIKDLIEKQKNAKKEIDNIQLSILNQTFTGKLLN